MKLGALVAAAGRSERMGRTKALLPLGQETFVTHLTRVLLRSGAAPVVVTVPEPPEGAGVERALADVRGVVVTRNLAPTEGLAGSLATALASLEEDVDALVLCPVDMPFVTTSLVKKLVAAVEGGALAAVPFVAQERGHPVVFARALFEELAGCAREGGARGVLERHDDDVALVPWGDPRVLVNVNTPEDYDRVMAAD